MKTHVVREPFSHEGKDYARGAEISDPELIAALRGTHHVRHMIQTHRAADAPEPAPAAQANQAAAPEKAALQK